MTQGFALRCVATGSAYKMIWTATQRRNRKISIPALCRHPNHLICTSGRNAMQRKPCIILQTSLNGMRFMTIYKEILSLMQYMGLKLQWSRYTQKNKAWDIVLHYLCFNSL